MNSWSAMRASARREWAWLCRSPWDIALVGWLPVLLLVLMAALFSAGVLRHVPVAVVDHDHSETSRALTRKLMATAGLQVTAMPASLDEAWSLVRRGQVQAVVHLPAGLSQDIARGRSGTVFAFYNASYLTIGQAAERDIASVVQAQAAETAQARTRYLSGRVGLQAVPVRVQSGVLFNAARSYQHFLLGLLLPAILQLGFFLAVVSAFGRELRDGTAPAWLTACGGRFGAALLGKLLPYLLLFGLYGAAVIAWVAGPAGDRVAGSLPLLLAGFMAMLLACAAVSLLFVGLTRNMGNALALAGLYAGVALAFSGSTFPLIEGPLFSRIWSHLLPFTAYIELQLAQLDIGASWQASMPQLGVLVLFVVLAVPPGVWCYRRACHDPASWGLR